METKRVILSLGGSLIIPETVNSEMLKGFRDLIVRKVAEGFEFVIFTGGGNTARLYMEGARGVKDMTDAELDWLGIHSSRLNAQLVRAVFGELAAEEIIVDPTLPVEMTTPVRIGAGWKPGWSTDYDAVQVAVTVGADMVVNLSNIEYAYTADPKQDKTATPIKETSWSEFQKIVGTEWKPGLNAPFDPIAAKLAAENKKTVIIANGQNLQNVEAIIDGGEFIGTIIRPD
jgi:uridylate kinase